MKQINSVCILGATGNIGIELTANLLLQGIEVHAVVRDRHKLLHLLQERKILDIPQHLKIYEADLFSEKLDNITLFAQALDKCSIICNVASPQLSWNPLSKINRQWSNPISSLTQQLIAHTAKRERPPHILVFCGSDYFSGYDKKIHLHHTALSKISRTLFPALQDNYLEARTLLDGTYPHWTVFRCGSICTSSGQIGHATNVAINYEKNGSNYREGKGCALRSTDLAAFLTQHIQNNTLKDMEREMPFTFNTQF